MIALMQWQSPHLVWLAVSSLIVALAVTAWSYRSQFPLTPSRSVWLLPVLRIAALAALLLSILRPVIVSAVNDQRSGVIAVLLDQSRSMSVVDRGRTPAELVRLAAALGMLPPQVRPTATSDLRQQVAELRRLVEGVDRAVSELEYARLSGRGIESAQAHLQSSRIALSEGVRPIYVMAPDDLTAPVAQIDTVDTGRMLRVENVLEKLDAIQAAADGQLYENNRQVREICDSLAGLSRIELARLALAGEKGLVQSLLGIRPVQIFGFSQSMIPLALTLNDVAADGNRTDVVSALTQLKQAMIGQRVSAVVIVSDGRSVESADVELTGWTGTPIFAVAPFAAVGRDLAVANVSIPREALVDQTCHIDVELAAAGYDGREVRVTLEGAGLAQTHRILISDGVGRGQIPVIFRAPGPQPLSIVVEPDAAEATTGNNRVSRIVKVVSTRLRVMLLASGTSRDSQDLANALRTDSSLVLTAHVQASEQSVPDTEQIAEQDVILLSEMPASALGAGQWDTLNQLVTRGGTVVFITSDPAVAATYASTPVTAAMLPYRSEGTPVAHVWPGRDPVFRIVPAQGNASSPMRLDDSPDQRRFSTLAPIHRFLSPPLLRVGARPVLVERELQLPVLTEMRLGQGRVLFLGLTDLARWRESSAPAGADWFWLNLVHAAAQAPYALTGDGMALDADSLCVKPGQPVRLRARIASTASAPTAIQIRRGDEPVGLASLRPVSGFNDRFEATIDGLAAGRYELRMVRRDSPRALSLALVVEQTDEAEMRDISGDEQELRRIAGSEGEVLPLDRIQALPHLVSRIRDTAPRFVERRLWDSTHLYLFVLSCFGLEWALRKRAGLT